MTPRKRLNHETPHWVTAVADYFVTICAEPRKQNHFCRDPLGQEILSTIHFYNEKHLWFCSLALLMPDHVHLLLSFPPDKIVAQVVGLWKRGLAKSHGILWQRNFFEHRLRNDENIQNKADYILRNPVRAGLVDGWQKWPYVWIPEAY